jgi:hypothetical protein
MKLLMVFHTSFVDFCVIDRVVQYSIVSTLPGKKIKTLSFLFFYQQIKELEALWFRLKFWKSFHTAVMHLEKADVSCYSTSRGLRKTVVRGWIQPDLGVGVSPPCTPVAKDRGCPTHIYTPHPLRKYVGCAVIATNWISLSVLNCSRQRS